VEVDLPVEHLQVSRILFLQRRNTFSQAFERGYGSKAKKVKPKKQVNRLKVEYAYLHGRQVEAFLPGMPPLQ
jgi:hypothetical protein